MFNLTFTIGGLEITPLWWSMAICFTLSSFSIWRHLRKEDFDEEEIFKYNLLILMAGIGFGNITLKLFDLLFLGVVWGIVLLTIWRFRVLKKNVWDVFDSLTPSLFFLLSFLGIGLFLSSGKYLNLGYLLLGIFGFLISGWWRKNYRKIEWYKSGRTGFVFWASCAFSFLGQLIIVIIQDRNILLKELLLIVSFVISFMVIYYRSERNLKEDYKQILRVKG